MMEQDDHRWEQRFSNFKKALLRLRQVAESGENQHQLSELEREGVIQRFEYTYELAWKTLQDFLRFKGYDGIAGPNPVLTQAVQDGYLTDPTGWRAMKKARELAAHTYDGDMAEEVAEAILSIYYPLLHQLEQRLDQERTGNQLTLF